MSENNIKSGFQATGIWPLNAQAVNQYMQPSVQFIVADPIHENEDTDNDEEEDNNMAQDEQGSNSPTREQYFIGEFEPHLQSSIGGMDCSSSGTEENLNLGNASQPSIHRFLQLPQVEVQGRQRKSREEPLVDYSKSIMFIS